MNVLKLDGVDLAEQSDSDPDQTVNIDAETTARTKGSDQLTLT